MDKLVKCRTIKPESKYHEALMTDKCDYDVPSLRQWISFNMHQCCLACQTCDQ